MVAIWDWSTESELPLCSAELLGGLPQQVRTVPFTDCCMIIDMIVIQSGTEKVDHHTVCEHNLCKLAERLRTQSQFKEDTIKPSVPAWEFNLKAYATIIWNKWSSQPGPWTQSLYPGCTYRDATVSATGACCVEWHTRIFQLSSSPADWRRQPEHLRIMWLSTIQQDLRHHNLMLPEAADMAQKRALWRIKSRYGAMQS